MNIGDRLKQLRQNNNLTLEEVGKRIGATKQTLYKYESGIVTNIPSDKIEALSKVYGTTPAFIMGWENKHKAIPVELHDIGVEWMLVAKEAKTSGLTPEQIKEVIATISKVAKVDKK